MCRLRATQSALKIVNARPRIGFGRTMATSMVRATNSAPSGVSVANSAVPAYPGRSIAGASGSIRASMQESHDRSPS